MKLSAGSRRIFLRRLFVFLLAVFPAVASPSESAVATGLSQVTRRILSLVETRGLRSIRWGICVARADTGRPLFSYHADDPFVPASNRKLFVTALALYHLGPDYRFSTGLFLSAPMGDRSHFHGDIIVRGVGDPTFLNPRFNSGSVTSTLREWAEALSKLGIRYVHGDLVMDSSGFDSAARIPDGWSKEFQTASYAPRPSGICIDANRIAVAVKPADSPGRPPLIRVYPRNSVVKVDNRAVTAKRGSADTLEILRAESGLDHLVVRGRIACGAREDSQRVPVEQPELVAGEVFRSILEKKGIKVLGRVVARTGGEFTSHPEWVRVAEYRSPPLREILAQTNKNSDNFCAEQLFQAVTFAETGRASYAEAKEFEEPFLAKIGILPDAAHFEDGCGLSRLNLVSPRAVVRLLSFMARGPYAQQFRRSLAVAGRDGTLARRMGRRAIGRVWAKTGNLSNASCLSGYAETRSGAVLAFSIMANNCKGRTADACYVQDKICDWLVNVRF